MPKLQWPSRHYLQELVQPFLLLNSTALFRLNKTSIVIQLVSKHGQTVLERHLYHRRDFRWSIPETPDSSETPPEEIPLPFVMNLESWMHRLNGTQPKSVEVFPIVRQEGFTMVNTHHQPPPTISTPPKYESWLVEFKTKPSHSRKKLNPEDETKAEPTYVEWDVDAAGHVWERYHPSTSWFLLSTHPYDSTSVNVFYDIESSRPGDGRVVQCSAVPQIQLDLLELSIFDPTAKLQVSSEHIRWQSQCNRLTTTYNLHDQHVSRTTHLKLPEWLQDELWARHEYSWSDVRRTLDDIPESLAWQLLVSFNAMATQTATSPNANDSGFTWGAKSGAIVKIMAHVERNHQDWEHRPNVLWDMAKAADPNGDGHAYDLNHRHEPCLPVHRLARDDFERIRNAKSQVLRWRGILIAQMESTSPDDKLMIMSRVVPYSEYCQRFGNPSSIAQEPNRVERAGQDYAVMDETFFFYSPLSSEESSSKRMRVV